MIILILEAIILGIIFGKIRGGSFRKLGDAVFRIPGLLFIVFIMHLITSIMVFVGNSFFLEYQLIIYIIVYLLFFIIIFFNLNYKSFWFVLVGTILNFTAIVNNNGRMPIDKSGLEQLGMDNLLNSLKSDTLYNYISLEEAVGFTEYLGKIWTTPDGYPLSQIFSLGDVFIALGVFFIIQGFMNISKSGYKTISFDYRKDVFK